MLMRTGRTWQKLYSFNDEERVEFMRQANECFKQIREFQGSSVLLSREETRLCQEFEQLLPAAADGLR